MDFGIIEVLIAAVVIVGGCWLWDWYTTIHKDGSKQNAKDLS